MKELLIVMCITFIIILCLFLMITIFMNFILKLKKEVYITHRGTHNRIEEIVQSGKLVPHMTKCKNYTRLKCEHNKSCIWVSLGKPNFYTYLGSGMIGKGASSYISFKVKSSLIKSPSGLKKAFPISQRVIEEEVEIPSYAIIKI